MAARLLNAQVIGGKPGDKWREDIWTMKYLSGFKWEMLGEQVGRSPPPRLFLSPFPQLFPSVTGTLQS